MKWKNSENSYGTLFIGIHWLMLLLFIGLYACINLHELYPKGSDPREALKNWHFMLGLSVFLLIWLRIAVRLTSPTPSIQPETQNGQLVLAAKLMHLALYALMIVMPLLGWFLLSTEGKPIPFFGLELPALIGKDKALASQIKEVHEFIGTIGYYLIGLHGGVALYHYYILHDNTLTRMLPDRSD